MGLFHDHRQPPLSPFGTFIPQSQNLVLVVQILIRVFLWIWWQMTFSYHSLKCHLVIRNSTRTASLNCVCLLCMKKTSKRFAINERYNGLIKRFIIEGLHQADNCLPNVIYQSCKRALSGYELADYRRTIPLFDHSKWANLRPNNWLLVLCVLSGYFHGGQPYVR